MLAHVRLRTRLRPRPYPLSPCGHASGKRAGAGRKQPAECAAREHRSFGHSRGGGAALNYMLRSGDVQAGVLSSSRYPLELTDLAVGIRMPVLMLHGTADSEADGGTEFTKVEMALSFERALRAAGKSVEAVYYEGGRHNDIFDSSVRYHDELRRSVAFFGHYLGLHAGTP
jgi:alpha-beta hydrolase superfamily lysophospholipase